MIARHDKPPDYERVFNISVGALLVAALITFISGLVLSGCLPYDTMEHAVASPSTRCIELHQAGYVCSEVTVKGQIGSDPDGFLQMCVRPRPE